MEAGRERGSRTEGLRPQTAALVGIAISALAWWALVFAGYGAERSACPDPSPALAIATGVATPLLATAGWLLTVWGYVASAGERSGQWLAGAAGLYVSTLAWAATLTGGIALFAVDLCSF